MVSEDRKIRVAHIVNRFDIGGMENGIVNICNMFDRERFAPMVYCLRGIGPMAERLKSDVPVINMSLQEGISLLPPFKLAKHFRKDKVNIVHTHGWGGGSLYGIIGAKIARVPIIINGEHGTFFNKKYQVILQRFLSVLCDKNLSVSESLKTKITNILGLRVDRIAVIKNGVDIYKYSGRYPKDKIYYRLRDEGYNFTEQSFYIVSIGSLKPVKAQIRLLKSIKKILKDNPTIDIKVLLIGDGPDRSMLENYVKVGGLNNIVYFLGNRSDIHEILGISDLMVSTSIDEGLSNVMLEAMSSGVPVVATWSPGTAELVIDNLTGFIAEPDETGQLGMKILQMYNDRDILKIMGANAKKYIHDHYDMIKMVKEYEQLYLNMFYLKNA